MADEVNVTNNNPSDGQTKEVHHHEDGSGMGFLLGIIVVILLIVLFFVYGMPGDKASDDTQDTGFDVNVTLPDTTSDPYGAGAGENN